MLSKRVDNLFSKNSNEALTSAFKNGRIVKLIIFVLARTLSRELDNSITITTRGTAGEQVKTIGNRFYAAKSTKQGAIELRVPKRKLRLCDLTG